MGVGHAEMPERGSWASWGGREGLGNRGGESVIRKVQRAGRLLPVERLIKQAHNASIRRISNRTIATITIVPMQMQQAL